MFAMTKRNLQLYFHSKANVFFSLMGAWIAFALYIIFLQKNMLDAWSAIKGADKMLDQWVMGGVLAVTGVTSTWTGAVRLVQDKESRKLDDFLMTDSSEIMLNLGYFLSAAIIGILMQVAMFIIMAGYFYWQDDLTFDAAILPGLLGLIVLNAGLGASLGLLTAQFIKKVEIAERLSVIIGTASGFLVGVYMPIGGMPDAAQSVMKLTPASYIAAAFRQLLIGDKVIDWQQPGIDVKEYLGIGLDWGALTTLGQNTMVASAVLVVTLLVLSSLHLVKKQIFR